MYLVNEKAQIENLLISFWSKKIRLDLFCVSLADQPSLLIIIYFLL